MENNPRIFKRLLWYNLPAAAQKATSMCRLTLKKLSGAPERIRTSDLRIRSPTIADKFASNSEPNCTKIRVILIQEVLI